MWNAEIYGQFEKERIQPSFDLAKKVEIEECHKILDIGCGSGLSTEALQKTFSEAEITGVDESENMLKRAKERVDGVKWIQKDCSGPLSDLGVFDLVFSNAFIQWIPNQDEFVMRTRRLLRKGGILAVQIPMFDEMKLAEIIKETAEEFDQEKRIFEGKELNTCFNFTRQEYYDIFTRYYPEVEIWQTEYVHQMKDIASILEFVKGSALIPYMECMSEDQITLFMQLLYIKVAKHYKTSENGMILFPFKRLFVIGRK